MESDFTPERTSGQLGMEAVDRAVALAEECCDYEREYIERSNQPRIEALRAEIVIHADEVADLEARHRAAGRPGDGRIRRRKVAYYLGIALTLVVAGFFFSIIAFEPYRVGWKGWLYCVGIATVTPFCVEQFLEKWNCLWLEKAVVAIGFAAAISSLVLLAVIRGNVIANQVQAEQAPAVQIDADDSAPTAPQNTFYQDTVALLRLTMALLAVSMELGAGISLHEARLLGPGSGENREELNKRLQETKKRMVQVLYESEELSNEAAAFVARFWSDFYRAMLTHARRRAIMKLLLILLLFPVLGRAQGQAPTGQPLDLVVELDLSTSVGAKGHDGKSEFEKNVSSITRLVADMPPNSRVTVLGITENSFSQPFTLLSAKTGSDSGYFGEKLKVAREQLVRAWRERSARLAPASPGTDILGALVVAGQVLQQAPDTDRKILVIFSDMRESTRHLDFESSQTIPTGAALGYVDKEMMWANLKGVVVYALGVDAAGQQVVQWDHVRQFWIAYFKRAGANLRTYSVTRDLLHLESSQVP